jgi:hypothetical protein
VNEALFGVRVFNEVIELNWCLYKKRSSGHTCVQRKDNVSRLKKKTSIYMPTREAWNRFSLTPLERTNLPKP